MYSRVWGFMLLNSHVFCFMLIVFVGELNTKDYREMKNINNKRYTNFVLLYPYRKHLPVICVKDEKYSSSLTKLPDDILVQVSLKETLRYPSCYGGTSSVFVVIALH